MAFNFCFLPPSSGKYSRTRVKLVWEHRAGGNVEISHDLDPAALSHYSPAPNVVHCRYGPGRAQVERQDLWTPVEELVGGEANKY